MISFDLTDEQKMMVETAGKLARERLRKAAREADESGAIPDGLLDTAWQLGFIQGSIPEAYDGFGAGRSALNGALFVEELAWGDLALALAAMSPALAAFPILSSGSEAQRLAYLPALCVDEFPRASAALVEPCYQFDPHHLNTSATKDGATYLLTGQKCLVPLAADAALILVYARDTSTDSTQAFLVDKNAAGLQVGDREANMGIKGLATYSLTLDRCRIPAAQRLGDSAGSNFASSLDASRIALSAMAVGVARGAFEYARDYAKERKQFGEPIASRQAIAFMLADMAIEIDAARLMAWEAAWQLDRLSEAGGRNENATREAYLARLYSDDMVLKVSDCAVQILGGHGYIREHPVEMWLRNARGFATFEGLATV